MAATTLNVNVSVTGVEPFKCFISNVDNIIAGEQKGELTKSIAYSLIKLEFEALKKLTVEQSDK